MAKNYKTKPFAEWTEEDFKQSQADTLASYKALFMLTNEISRLEEEYAGEEDDEEPAE